MLNSVGMGITLELKSDRMYKYGNPETIHKLAWIQKYYTRNISRINPGRYEKDNHKILTNYQLIS